MSEKLTITKDDLKIWVREGMDPYSAFTRTKSPKEQKEYLKKVRKTMGIPKEQQPDDIYDNLVDDLSDDYSNCGGLSLHRMDDLITFAPIFTEEQRDKLIDLYANQMFHELEDLNSIISPPKRPE